MPILTFTGNLTQPPALKTTKEGRKYYLLQIAENIRKRNNNGDYIKDTQGHYVNLATYFYSVFIYDHALCFDVQHLTKGDAVYVKGIAHMNVTKNDQGYDTMIVDRITATFIDTNPFDLSLHDQSSLTTDEVME